MGFQEFVTERLAAITAQLNAIAVNAKKIFELPVQSTLDPSSLIHVSRDGVSESLSVQKIIDAINSESYDKIIAIGDITLDENEVTIPSGAEWKINDVHYGNIAEIAIPIPLADTGLTRTDILVANTSNTIILIQGLETDGIAVRPNIPINTVLVTEINVTDLTIGDPSIPIIGDSFVKKTDFGEVIIESIISETTTASLSASVGGIRFKGTNPSFESLLLYDTSNLYPGKKFVIKNSQAVNLIVKHMTGIGQYKFSMPNEEDLTLKAGEIAPFDFKFTDDGYGVFEYVGIINAVTTVEIADVTGLTAELANKADLVAGLVPSSQLPAYIDDIIEGYLSGGIFYMEVGHTTVITGEQGKIYVDLTSGQSSKQYRWSGSVYIQITNGLIASTADVPENAGYLYFTTARVLATVLTGISFVTGGAITAADSVLVAFGKLQKQISDNTTAIALKADKTDTISIAMSDGTTVLATGDTDPMKAPYNFTLLNYWVGVKIAPTVSSLIVDVKKNGTSITSTKCGIDATEFDSLTGTSPVLTTTSFVKGDVITPNIYQVGSGETGRSLKIYLEIIKT